MALVPAAAGCSGGRPAAAPPPGPEEASVPVWPAPPEVARVRYVGAISGPADAGIRRSAMRRLGGALFGRQEERLLRPVGISGREGVLSVADAGGRSLHIFDLGRRSFRRVSRLDGVEPVSPVGVAAANGSFYLADSSLATVFKLDPRGRVVGRLGEGQLERPTGLALDPDTGRLYVADTRAHRIVVYGPGGAKQGTIGRRGDGDGEFNFPTYLLLDRQGLLHVVDSMNFRVQVFDPAGRYLRQFGSQGNGSGNFASPKGIAADSQGHIYVVDALFDAVQIFDTEGRLLLTFGERGIGPGQLWLPTGIHIDAEDRVYVADSHNHRIQIFQFLGGPDEPA